MASTPVRDDFLARLLVQRQLLPAGDAERILADARSDGPVLERTLIESGAFSREELLGILENHFFCPSIDVRQTESDTSVLERIPFLVATRHLVLPIRTESGGLKVAFGCPDDAKARAAVNRAADGNVVPCVAFRHELSSIIKERYTALIQARQTAEMGRKASGRSQVTVGERQAPVADRWELPKRLERRGAPDVVDEILKAATRHRVTDIHIEPRESALEVRFRLDGMLHPVVKISAEVMVAVLSRIKVMAHLDISERRVPQDGRVSFTVDDDELDLRISTLPSQFGEKIVIRLLRKDATLLDLDRLQMPEGLVRRYRDAVESPMGFFLVTGPTGCGKTTTLYATLCALDRRSTNVVTLEDPIEYRLESVTQVQIKEDQGLTLASGLRSILRQDPDVVLVGEVRDVETAEIAFRASLTGHKVFSTLHTNDASQAVTRLLDMGASPYLIAATLRGVLAQRLIRMICDRCRETYQPNEAERALLGYPKIDVLSRGTGCEACAGTGYRGRVAVFEYLQVDDVIHRLIMERASHLAMRHAAERAGMVTMGEAGKRLALDGRTTVAEIQRVLLGAEEQQQLCDRCQRVVGLDFVICPFCQHRLKDTCGACKANLDPHWEACPRCGTAIERDWNKTYCSGCMAPVDPQDEQCPYCGGVLDEQRAIA